MDKNLHIVIGMTIAYAASFLGLIIAWVAYARRRKHEESARTDLADEHLDDNTSRD